MVKLKIQGKYKTIMRLAVAFCLLMPYTAISQDIKTFSLEKAKISSTDHNNSVKDFRKILLINSYHFGYQWTDTLTKEIQNDLKDKNGKIELFIENLDSKRIGEQKSWDLKVKNILNSYPENYLDMILATDDNALQSLINNMNEELVDIPIIFCGVSNYNQDDIKQHKNITGIVQIADSQKTIQLALSLFPKTLNIAVITDNSTTGKTYKKQLERTLEALNKNIIWLDGNKISYQDLHDKISSLPKYTIVLMGIWQRDCQGDYYKMENVYPEISQTCNMPIFGITDFGIGYGILGGYISCAETQAEKLTDYASRIINTSNNTIPEVNSNGFLKCKFDYKQITRWGIKKSALPQDTIYLNEPPQLSQSVKMTIWTGAVTLVLFFALIVMLITYIFRYKKVNKLHNRYYKQTSLLWENIPTWCGAINAKGDFLLTNEINNNYIVNLKQKWGDYADAIIKIVKECINEQDTTEMFFKKLDKTFHVICNPVPFESFNQNAVVCIIKDTTEQDQIKQEIIKKNNILNLALKAVKSCYWIWNPNNNNMEIDEHFWLCQGIDPVNSKTEHDISFFWNGVNINDAEHAREQLKMLAQNQISSCKYECRLSHSGEDIWFLIRANVLNRNQNGKPEQISVFMTKIDSNKRTELELKEKEKLLSISQEMAKVGYWISNPTSGILIGSPESYKIWDIPYTAEGKCNRELFRNKITDIKKWDRLLNNLHQPGDSFETTFCLDVSKNEDSDYKTIWSKVSLKIDSNQKPVYVGVSQDITEHVKMQNELKNREKYLLQAATLAKMFYWHYNVNQNNFIFTNSSAVWGENNIDGIQTVYSITERIHPEDRKECTKQLQKAISGEMPKGSLTYRSINNGVIKYITTMWEAYFESDGTLEGMIGISMDVTEAKEREKLEISKMEAEAMAKTKSRFLATMSHEIRTPINVVIGMNHLLKETQLNEIQINFIKKIEHAANSLLAIVNDVLDISKIEENKLAIEKIDFSLSEIAFNTASVMAVGAEKKDVEIHVTIDKNLPARLFGDPLRLSQILTNYMSNAIKFTDKGDITLSIKQVDRSDDSILVEFAVKDSGIGIIKENLDKLFDAYTQAEKSTARIFGGTGLGLAICKQLAELMEGSVKVNSELGEGSTFCVTLPFDIPEDAGEQASYKIPELKGKKALIIDDNHTSIEILKELVSTAGFDVTAVSSGKEGIEVLEQADSKYDLAIIDWAMPEMNGIQTVREIKQRFQDSCPKLIAVTAHNHESVMHQCLNAGYAGFIIKPIVPGEMINAIRKAFNLSALVMCVSEEEKTIPNLVGKKILIVEDQEINQEIIINILNKTNAEIDIANNGEEATIKVNAEDYHLVLMDIQMPVMDGICATKEIRKNENRQMNHLPIVAMSANAMSEDIEESLNAGMNDYITKPIIPDILYKKISDNICMTSDTAELASLIHIDAQAGISLIDGNTQLYLKMLKDFTWHCPKQAKELNSAVHEGKHQQASEVAHIIKGIAGSIGARDLMNLAAELEISLENSSEDIEQVCKKVTNEVNTLIEEIHAAFENKNIDVNSIDNTKNDIKTEK